MNTTDDLVDDCPFCEYAAAQQPGGPTVVNGRKIFYDRPRPVMWFEPLNPVTPGHRLFVPTWHAEHRNAVGATAAFRSAYDAATQWNGPFNLILSSGHAATQTVDHLHVHYIPRRPGDGLQLPWGGPR